jgi:hypothetical protein
MSKVYTLINAQNRYRKKQESTLLYELGRIACGDFFQRSLTKSQILARATQEIDGLKAESLFLEKAKQVKIFSSPLS